MYGQLMYDIPKGRSKNYYALMRGIAGKCVRLNYSVYIFQWGQLDDLTSAIQRANCDDLVRIFKYDENSREDIERTARECLVQQAQRILHSLNKAIEEEAVNFKRLKTGEQKIAELQTAALLFGFTNDIEHVVGACKKLLRATLRISERDEQFEFKLFEEPNAIAIAA